MIYNTNAETWSQSSSYPIEKSAGYNWEQQMTFLPSPCFLSFFLSFLATLTLSPPSRVILQNPHLFWDLQALHCLQIAIGALLHPAGLFFYSFFLFQ
jgi:hypothetical protein